MAVVLYKLSGKRQGRWYIKDPSKDFHTQHGAVPSKKLKPGTFELYGDRWAVVDATFLDEYKAMRRHAQIITRKDIGFVIGYCGLGKKSVVVESGAGSGGATLMLANVCKKVHSYEINEENIAVVKENLKRTGLSNVEITHADFYEKKSVKVKDADVVLLDLPEPWRATDSVKKCLSKGGYLVVYTPTIVQAQQFMDDLPTEFLHERTLELMDRDWKVEGRAVRPTNASIGHTGFLTVVRRV